MKEDGTDKCVPKRWRIKFRRREITQNSSYLPAYEDGTDSVPKRWHIKFRRRGITQKKAYNNDGNVKYGTDIKLTATLIPLLLVGMHTRLLPSIGCSCVLGLVAFDRWLCVD